MSVDRLLDELRTEFEGEVAFHATVPANPTAPSIIVAPADPFLEPGTHGTVRESWDVLVAFRIDAPERNVGPMRDYSLRIRAAAARAGAVWESASVLAGWATTRARSQSPLTASTTDTRRPKGSNSWPCLRSFLAT